MIGLVGPAGSVHVQRWATGLAARGHRVRVIDLSGRKRSPVGRLRALIALRRQLREVLRAEDGVISLHYAPAGLLATALRGFHPICISVWGSDVAHARVGFGVSLAKEQQRALLARADARTATSEYLRSVLESRFGCDATVVPFGVDLERFTPRPSQRATGSVTLGFAKWLTPKYGADVLLAALARVHGDWRLRIAGEGPMDADLKALSYALGISTKVEFVGQLPHAEMPSFLAGLDIFVMPSRAEEFGVAAAEASAAGLPVVATDVGGVGEVVEDGVTGILVGREDPASLAAAISQLIADAELRWTMGGQGRARMEARFNWEESLIQMEAVLALIVGRD